MWNSNIFTCILQNLQRKLLFYWPLFKNSRIFISSLTFLYFSVYCWLNVKMSRSWVWNHPGLWNHGTCRTIQVGCLLCNCPVRTESFSRRTSLLNGLRTFLYLYLKSANFLNTHCSSENTMSGFSGRQRGTGSHHHDVAVLTALKFVGPGL